MSIGSIIAAVVAAILGALFGALRLRRQDNERDDAIKGKATAEAEVETQDVIGEIADARSNLPVGGSAADIAARLRKRRSFGNPGTGEDAK